MNEATGGEGATVQQKEIITIADIRLLVDTFYGRARQDELIGPVFNNTIKDRWPQHLDRLYGFWETVLLGRRSYHGVPFMPMFRCRSTGIISAAGWSSSTAPWTTSSKVRRRMKPSSVR